LYVLIISIDFRSFLTTVYACRRRGAAAVPARSPGAVGVEHHERARLLPDPDGGAGGALHEQRLQGVRAAVAVSPGARKKGSPLKFRRFVTLTDGLQARYSAGRFTFAPQDPSKC